MISAGDCPVCFDAGDVVFVRRNTGEIFFVCPACGCAWESLSAAGAVNTIDAPEAFASDGWMVATREENTAAGLASLVQPLAPFDESVFDRMAGFSKREAT